ncbi:hypothetical protein ACHRV5_10970 [Flavobacterium sp. FlaQc-52]|uniref:hypothetical protein n=1 Tax=Flavobacterium sp. FlaQc-52 TaxID=3374185 RepID=UPI00375789FD
MEDKLTISSRTNYSSQHIKAACFFARKAYELEKLRIECKENLHDDREMEYKSYSTSAIFLSVAFLESIINEFFSNVSDESIMSFDDNLDAKNVQMIKRLWSQDVPRTASFSIVRKYEIALIACEKDTIDKSDVLFNDIKSLIQLRNSLIHYEPQWNLIYSDEFTNEKGLTLKLKNKFSLSPFAGRGSAFFPERCIGHGCAEWGIINSIKFVDNFYHKLGMKTTYEIIRSQLNAK